MKKSSVFLLAIFFLSSTSFAQDIVGYWRTIDDETGKAKSIVKIYKAGNEIKGQIAKLLNPDEPHPKCAKCEGTKKNQSIEGLEILWNLKTDGTDNWAGGNILDPANGKTYRVKATLKEAGAKLEVRGFIGVSLFGRSQTWERVDETAVSQESPNATSPGLPDTK